MSSLWILQVAGLAIVGTLCVGCGERDAKPQETWQVVHQDLAGGLLSVWGTSSNDVWAVGGDPDGEGPTVLHFDGSKWAALSTGTTGDLSWVFGFDAGPVYMGGEGGTILSYANGKFERMETPSREETIFGIWGSSPDDVWAVGGRSGGANGAFAWHLEDGTWREATGFPTDLSGSAAVWKAFGRSGTDAWLVGTNGLVLRWDGSTFTTEKSGVSESLFTVHANAERFAAVGGFGTGLILENDGGGWKDRSPKSAPPFSGVFLSEASGYAVGQFGAIYSRSPSGWREVHTGLSVDQTLHSVWIDDEGGVWAVGGDVLTKPLVRGVMLHGGKRVPGGSF